jgi:hypothetical protein
MTLSLMPVNPATDFDADRRLPEFRRFLMTAPSPSNGDESNTVTGEDEISSLKRGIAFLLIVGLIPILIGWLIHTFFPGLLGTDTEETPEQSFMMIRTDVTPYFTSGSVGGLSRDGRFPVDQLQLHGIVTAE